MSKQSDLDFLKEIKERIETGDTGYALEIIQHWIEELEGMVPPVPPAPTILTGTAADFDSPGFDLKKEARPTQTSQKDILKK